MSVSESVSLVCRLKTALLKVSRGRVVEIIPDSMFFTFVKKS